VGTLSIEGRIAFTEPEQEQVKWFLRRTGCQRRNHQDAKNTYGSHNVPFSVVAAV
jgi:hypothetical protein